MQTPPTKFPLHFPFPSAIIPSRCGYSSSVECELPKLERWVRFPLPAPKRKDTPLGCLPFLWYGNRRGRPCRRQGKKHAGGIFFSPGEIPITRSKRKRPPSGGLSFFYKTSRTCRTSYVRLTARPTAVSMSLRYHFLPAVKLLLATDSLCCIAVRACRGV